MPHQYHFDVTMSCSGCSNAVSRALGRVEGVLETKTDLDSQTVDVSTTDAVDYDTVYNAISKTGKKINGGAVVN